MIRRSHILGGLFCALMPTLPLAATLEFPGAPRVIKDETVDGTLFALPIGGWNGTLPTVQLEGAIQNQVLHLSRDAGAYRVADGALLQLTEQGFDIRHACRDTDCGGFDFRFALRLIPAPDMFVDLGHFAFVSAIHPDGRAVMILTSRTQDNVHVHLTTVTPKGADATDIAGVVQVPTLTEPTAPLDLPTALETQGRFILSDLRFQTGSSQLDGEEFDSLAALADYLSANPQRTIALVGHTDATGSLDGNIALSKKRAGAVRTVLLGRYGIAPERVAAEGMGYLAPVAPNTTEQGRSLNRRVEAIVTSTTE